MLTDGCSATFVAPDCVGNCHACTWESAKAKCQARKLQCQGYSTDGIKFPFMDNPAKSLLGLFSGEDMEILDFRPPPMVFGIEIEISILLYSPPFIYLVFGFGATATLEFAMVSSDFLSSAANCHAYVDRPLPLSFQLYRYLIPKACAKPFKKRTH